MLRTRKANIKGVFDRMKKRATDIAAKEMAEALPYAVITISDIVHEVMESKGFSSMTGNYVNSFGIALYRDGKLIAVATTADVESKEPLMLTLAEGDKFKKGWVRYDGETQQYTFKAGEDSTHRILANEEVIRWMRRYSPTRKKGLAYRIVTVVDYAKKIGGSEVMLRLADEIESQGGDIREFKFL